MKKKNNIYIILALMLMLNAMVLIGTLGTFESNEQFAPSPEKIEVITNKHIERTQSENTEDLRQYATDLMGLAKSSDNLLAGSYEVQNLLRKIIYWICGFNLFAVALAMTAVKNKP